MRLSSISFQAIIPSPYIAVETAPLKLESFLENSGYELKFDHTSKLILETYQGAVTFETILNAQKAKFRYCEFNRSYSVITDISNADIYINEIDLIRLIDLMQAYNRDGFKCGNCKNAVIACTFEQIEIATIYKVFSESKLPLSVRIFSSEKASKDWLLYDC